MATLTKRVFGPVPGVVEGDGFKNRLEVSQARLHRPIRIGIAGSPDEGAESIVLSGQYEDDEDHGNHIFYVGHGGRDAKTGRQTADQTLTGVNAALARSVETGLPVRVIRGPRFSAYAPDVGYRYDGLYRVKSHEPKRGKSGFRVWVFRLEKVFATFGNP